MHTRNYIIIGTLVSALAFLGAACGDDIECGTGTIEMDGVCVPTDAVCGPNATWDSASQTCVGATCADGTTLEDGECVPDGSVICGDGTTYNETTGECDPDITECAEGTTDVDGVCVPNDDLLPDEADVAEGAEDNGWNGTPGSFSLPEVGQSRTIYGCVTPFLDEDEDGELDPDYDLYVFSITAPTLVNIKVDGIAGLSGGFEIYSLDEDLADYWRVGMNLVDDVSERQVYLPKAGDYILVLSDSRSIWLRTAAGSADTCYFATVTHVAAPSPTAWTTAATKMCWDGTACTTAADCAGIGDMFDEETCDFRVQDSYSSDVTFYSYDTDEGDILRPWLATTGTSSEGALLNMRNGALHAYSAATGTAGNAAQYWAAGYADDDTLTIVVDHVYNYALQPVDYMLDVYDPGAVALAEDGSTATLTPGRYGNAYGYFDVATGEVDDVLMHHTVSPPAGYSCYIIPPDESVYPACSAENYDEWIQFVEGGRAYIEVSWTEEVDTIDVDSTITHVMPTAIEVGTLIDNATLPEHGNGWYELDVSASDWLVSTAPETTDFLGAMAVDLYSRTNTGAIDSDLYSVDDFTLADPTEEVGRIVIDDDSVFLLRITDDAFDGTGDTETYDFLVDDRDYTDLGTIEVDTPIDEADLDIDALGTEYFLLYADPAEVAKVDITSTGDTPVARCSPRSIRRRPRPAPRRTLRRSKRWFPKRAGSPSESTRTPTMQAPSTWASTPIRLRTAGPRGLSHSPTSAAPAKPSLSAMTTTAWPPPPSRRSFRSICSAMRSPS